MARCGQVIGEAVEDDVAAREARRVQGARCAPPVFRLAFDRIGEQAPQQPRARGVEAAKRRLLVAQARQFIAAQHGKLGKFILATKFNDLGGTDQATQPGGARLRDGDDCLQVPEERELPGLESSRLKAIHEIRHSSSPRSDIHFDQPL